MASSESMAPSGQMTSASGASGTPGEAKGGNSGGAAGKASPAAASGTAGMAAPNAQPPRDAASESAGSTAVPAAGGTGGSPDATGEGTAGTVAGEPPSAGAGGSETPPEGTSLNDMQTLIPDASWDCGKPEGIPGPATGELVFEINFTVSEVHDIGQTQYGHRVQIDVSGGSVTGSKLEATVMDRGLDYQLTLENGVVELEQIHILRSGSASILMRNCGLAPTADGPVRVVLDFEAPNSSAASWLNTATLIGVRELDVASKKLTMKVYEVSSAPDAANAVQVPAAPPGPHQTWECAVASGRQGAEVYRETVGIGGSISVGESKRGNRNIIPITGGSTSGRVPGTVLSGGADFQIIAGGTFEEIDARYTVRSTEGDLIIVRNCGPLGGLVPVFEANKDSKYAWLNENVWLSSNPGLGLGAVNLTIYERQ